MEKPKASGAGAKSSRSPKAPARNTSPNRNEQANKYTLKSDFWESMLDIVPPWFGEVVGFILVVFGVLSLLSVLNVTADASVSIAWSNALTTAFGVAELKSFKVWTHQV